MALPMNEKLLDETGWLLLQELQQNARLSYSELGQRVGLSSPAVADRMRKMEEAGIITGYRTEINLGKLGLPMMAIIRLGSFAGQSCNSVAAQVGQIPEVLECYRVTGSDSVIAKVVAGSVEHLGKVVDQLSLYGLPTTSLVISKGRESRLITHEIVKCVE
ncbi:Lrp/AsnC family transcriptional regulator [Tengunoibacter tsumagoiensis]|uniref:AsnC family transcriptional regulator n=1 Tax=Tengunoibacter tsumagoiensis TaxID=2014871 RepID=A0A402A679_9CHLR|nr:Lrp/AsnC family transcriptional regulator [Tengunoibacter tsumagoiensis]GCE14657.1 AsnC family transcriptional regulator [Tengunoibacter tsumagoiensis]